KTPLAPRNDPLSTIRFGRTAVSPFSGEIAASGSRRPAASPGWPSSVRPATRVPVDCSISRSRSRLVRAERPRADRARDVLSEHRTVDLDTGPLEQRSDDEHAVAVAHARPTRRIPRWSTHRLPPRCRSSTSVLHLLFGWPRAEPLFRPV